MPSRHLWNGDSAPPSQAGRDVETGRRREAPGRGRCLALSRFPAGASVVRRSWERAPRPQGERLVPAWPLRLPFGRLLTGPPVGTLGLGSASRRHWAGFVTRGLKLLNPFEPLPRRGTLQPAFRPQILKSLCLRVSPGPREALPGPASLAVGIHKQPRAGASSACTLMPPRLARDPSSHLSFRCRLCAWKDDPSGPTASDAAVQRRPAGRSKKGCVAGRGRDQRGVESLITPKTRVL